MPMSSTESAVIFRLMHFANYPARRCRPDGRFRGQPRLFAALALAFLPGRAPPRPPGRCEAPLLTGSAFTRESGS